MKEVNSRSLSLVAIAIGIVLCGYGIYFIYLFTHSYKYTALIFAIFCCIVGMRVVCEDDAL